MKTDNTHTILGKYVRLASIVCAFFILFGTTAFLYTDLRYFSFDDPYFSFWQIPLLIFFIFSFWGYCFYLLFTKQGLRLVLFSVLWGAAIVFLPYSSYGDLKRLRDLSLCYGDGRSCRENLFDYLTPQWCRDKGFIFDKENRLCLMRID